MNNHSEPKHPLKTKIDAWIDKCCEDTVLLPLRKTIWKNEFEVARDVFSSDFCRDSAITFLNSLEPVEVCDADKSEKLRNEGNVLYKDFETLPEAVVLYTRAIYTAPSNSRLLAEAHANRAAALCKLEEYEAAYEDCVCALDFSHPKTRMIHLRLATIALKLCDSNKLEDCMKRFEKNGMTEESIFKRIQEILPETKSKPISENEPPMPKGKKIKMLYSKERGRYTVADENIEANEIIISNAPAVVTLDDKYRRQFLKTSDNNLTFICNSCYEQDIVPFPCYQCRSVFYCSSKCRCDHTPIHQYECNRLKLDLENEIGAVMRFLFVVFDSLLIKLTQANDGKVFEDATHLWPALLQAGKEDEWMELFMNFYHFQSVHRCFRGGLLMTLCCCYLWNHSDFLKTRRATCLSLMRSEFEWQIVVTALLLRFHIQNAFNSYMLRRLLTVKPFAERFIKANGLSRTLEYSKCGGITCPRAAVLNHSCDPSCFALKNKATVSVISQRSIRKGEELTVSYSSDDFETPAERKDFLWMHFGFVCSCRRCKTQLDLDYIQSNRVLCTCGNALVLNEDSSHRCPQCCSKLEVRTLLTAFLSVSLVPDSVRKYYDIYDLYKRIEKLAPKTSTNIWHTLGGKILELYLQSKNAEIYRDEKLLSMLTYVATDLLKVLEENKRIPVLIRVLESLALLDLIVVRKKNGFRKADLEYDLNKIKEFFWIYSGKERKWLEGYFNMCESIQTS